MKKILAIAIIVPLFVSSQTLKVSGGVTNGNLDWRLGNIKFWNKPTVGYSAHIGLDYLEKKYFFISTNMGVLQKGGIQKMIITDPTGVDIGTANNRAVLNYASVNTTFNLQYPNKSKITPFLTIGPRVDLLLSTSDNINPGDVFNKTTTGINFGAGAKYSFVKIIIGIRYEYLQSFGKIYSYMNSFGDENFIKDRTSAINAFVGFRLHK